MSGYLIIEKGFADDRAKEHAPQYTSELLTTWRDAERSLSRTLLLLFIVAVAAELIARGDAREATVGFVKLTDLELIHELLPAVFAYLYAAVAILAADTSMQEVVFRQLVRHRWPSLWRAHLDRPLYPANSTLFTTERFVHSYRKASRMRKLLDAAFWARFGALVIAPLAFEVYVFVRLFDRYGVDVISAASAAISATLIGLALMFFWAAVTVFEEVDVSEPGGPAPPDEA